MTMVAGLRSIAKAMELPPEPNVRAPALDPTCEGLGVKLLRPTHLAEGRDFRLQSRVGVVFCRDAWRPDPYPLG